MEEPDVGGDRPEPVIFTATGKDNAGSSVKKEAKKSMGERLRARKSIPRSETKGTGKKRFILTPSPKVKPAFKRAATGEGSEEKVFDPLKKRNLMGDLNKAAVRIEEEVSGLLEKAACQLQEPVTFTGEQGKGSPEIKSGAPIPHARNPNYSELETGSTCNKENHPAKVSSEKEEETATLKQMTVAKGQEETSEDIPRMQKVQAGILAALNPTSIWRKIQMGMSKVNEMRNQNWDVAGQMKWPLLSHALTTTYT